MPSPVAHSLIGLAAANVPLKHRLYSSIFWFVFVVFAANAPDLDFIPGLMVGNINKYHHGISHSIGMAIIFALLSGGVAWLMKKPYKQVFVIALIMYSSHLLADYFTIDRVEPHGMQLLWPFSREYFLAPVQLFHPVEHGNIGDAHARVFDKIFSNENVVAAGVEILIVLPMWLFTFWLSRRGGR